MCSGQSGLDQFSRFDRCSGRTIHRNVLGMRMRSIRHASSIFDAQRPASDDGDQSPKSRSKRPPKLSSFADAASGGNGEASGGSGPPSIRRCS